MSKLNFKSFIVKFSQTPIVIHPIYIKLTDSYSGAIFLSQVIYWETTMGREFYKTNQEWCNDLYMSEYELNTARKHASKYIKIVKKSLPAKNYYSVNWDILEQDIEQTTLVSRDQYPKNLGSLVPQEPWGTTSETTSETTTIPCEVETSPSFQDFMSLNGCREDVSETPDSDGNHQKTWFEGERQLKPQEIAKLKNRWKRPNITETSISFGGIKDINFEIQKLSNSKSKIDKIVALVWLRKGYNFENYEQLNSQLGKDRRFASELKGYSSDQIKEAMEICVKESSSLGYDWGMSTVIKKITQTLK